MQEVPEFIMTSANASRRVNGTEATHWPISRRLGRHPLASLFEYLCKKNAVVYDGVERWKEESGEGETLAIGYELN
jgi:hypothetical protein